MPPGRGPDLRADIAALWAKPGARCRKPTTADDRPVPDDFAFFEEEEGFEPPALSRYGFQDRRLRPLGHSSETNVSGTYALLPLPVNDALSIFVAILPGLRRPRRQVITG